MRFEGEAKEEEGPPIRETGNRWYFFVPLPLVGLWVVVAAARAVSDLVAPGGIESGVHEPAALLYRTLDVIDWLGGVGWVLLFVFYFALHARKRASSWWLLGAFCCCLNLPLYIALLCQPPRRRATAEPALPNPLLGHANLPRRSIFRVKDSFACESCDALLNYGVSECPECGERYRYADGQPLVDDSPLRRGR